MYSLVLKALLKLSQSVQYLSQKKGQLIHAVPNHLKIELNFEDSTQLKYTPIYDISTDPSGAMKMCMIAQISAEQKDPPDAFLLSRNMRYHECFHCF